MPPTAAFAQPTPYLPGTSVMEDLRTVNLLHATSNGRSAKRPQSLDDHLHQVARNEIEFRKSRALWAGVLREAVRQAVIDPKEQPFLLQESDGLSGILVAAGIAPSRYYIRTVPKLRLLLETITEIRQTPELKKRFRIPKNPASSVMFYAAKKLLSERGQLNASEPLELSLDDDSDE